MKKNQRGIDRQEPTGACSEKEASSKSEEDKPLGRFQHGKPLKAE